MIVTGDDGYRYARISTAEYNRVFRILADEFGGPHLDINPRASRVGLAIFKALGVGSAPEASVKEA
jgi:hypothetical protein